MCGIAGFIDFKNNSSKEMLNRMTAAVAHRGPDGQGLFFHTTPNCQVGLGHRRLSIIDLSTVANQPMEFDGLQII
ncbi:MAG: asparagine synthetase B, partial [Chitinophagaceae bacterium]|nr:asparagine synthetase B [Chitinophagaceae bacterium]